MSSRLMSLLGRENGDREEARVREEESWPQISQGTMEKSVVLGRESELVSSPLAGTREIAGCDGLEPSRARVQELGGGQFLGCFSASLKGQRTSKMHGS